jgi:hypothetical protein
VSGAPLAKTFTYFRFIARSSGQYVDFEFEGDSRAVKSICKINTREDLKKFVKKWVHDNTTPSSNTHNVIHSAERGITFDHVVHWYVLQVSDQIERTNLCIRCTETITALYDCCLLEAVKKDFQFFSCTFFFSCLPFYVHCKLQQDGFCPYHHTGIVLCKELVCKRKFWHINCHCSCMFCSPDGCNHGANSDGNCAEFSCSKCVDCHCPCEWCNISTNWLRPEQLKHPEGGIYWVNQEYVNT